MKDPQSGKAHRQAEEEQTRKRMTVAAGVRPRNEVQHVRREASDHERRKNSVSSDGDNSSGM